MTLLRQIVIEVEAADASRTMFRLRVNSSVIAKALTAVQAQLLVGELLDRIALPELDAPMSA